MWGRNVRLLAVLRFFYASKSSIFCFWLCLWCLLMPLSLNWTIQLHLSDRIWKFTIPTPILKCGNTLNFTRAIYHNTAGFFVVFAGILCVTNGSELSQVIVDTIIKYLKLGTPEPRIWKYDVIRDLGFTMISLKEANNKVLKPSCYWMNVSDAITMYLTLCWYAKS